MLNFNTSLRKTPLVILLCVFYIALACELPDGTTHTVTAFQEQAGQEAKELSGTALTGGGNFVDSLGQLIVVEATAYAVMEDQGCDMSRVILDEAMKPSDQALEKADATPGAEGIKSLLDVSTDFLVDKYCDKD